MASEEEADRKKTGEPAPSDNSSIDETIPAPAGEADDDLTDFETIDQRRYKLGSELARGGMGRILRARDRRLGRSIAIKELLGAGPILQARFRREALITARLQHPAIVPIHEAGRWPSGEPFYAMKMV